MTMLEATIDGRTVRAQGGTTILQAARGAGIRIPSLCYRRELGPVTSCMVCVVEIRGTDSLAPACTAPLEDGMVIETASGRVLEARRTAVELLLSEHAGDCIAPCQKACPFHMDIPAMIRCIGQRDPVSAGKIIASSPCAGEDGCLRQCEKACRRNRYDEPVAIALLAGFVTCVTGGSGCVPDAGVSQDTDMPGQSMDDIRMPDIPASVDKQRFNSVMKRITEEELERFTRRGGREQRVRPENPGAGYDESESRRESRRCMHCDCRKKDGCELRELAGTLAADQTRYRGERTSFQQHVFNDYIFEPGKCIKCGICVRISELKGLSSGFCFSKRGFDTQAGVAFDRFENPELLKIIGLIAENCPTGALVLNDET